MKERCSSPWKTASDLRYGEAMRGLGSVGCPQLNGHHPGAREHLATAVHYGGSRGSSRKQQVLVIINIYVMLKGA